MYNMEEAPEYSILDHSFFTDFLQRNLTFTIGNKTIKKGKLIIYRKSHFCIQFVLANTKNSKETIELPIPYNTEYHANDKLFYFDYRIKTLSNNNKDVEERLRAIKIKNVTPSQYYDKIVEIHIQ